MTDEVQPARHADLQSRTGMRDLILKAWTTFDPSYEIKRAPPKARLADLSGRLDALQASGHPMVRSTQIRDEAKWLLNYRADWPRLNARLDALEGSLLDLDQDDPVQAEDGSWAGAVQEFYRKLEPTVDALQSRRLDRSAARPLAFMARLADPAALRGYLWRLQVSDIAATGRNNRDELGAVQSALSQLIYKDDLRALLDDPRWGFAITDELETAYADFMRQTQHPRTGYWGPWYSDGGRLQMVQDLSYTFHHVSYRGGSVPNWPRLAETTLRIRDSLYPNGWRPSDDVPFDDHNDYDVVQIFFHGWPHMTRAAKALATAAIGEMLHWCLTQSLAGGRFQAADPVQAYYFGVRFLDRVGYWDDAKRFWTRDALPTPEGLPPPGALARQLATGFEALRDGSETGDTVRGILRSAACTADGPAVA